MIPILDSKRQYAQIGAEVEKAVEAEKEAMKKFYLGIILITVSVRNSL